MLIAVADQLYTRRKNMKRASVVALIGLIIAGCGVQDVQSSDDNLGDATVTLSGSVESQFVDTVPRADIYGGDVDIYEGDLVITTNSEDFILRLFVSPPLSAKSYQVSARKADAETVTAELFSCDEAPYFDCEVIANSRRVGTFNVTEANEEGIQATFEAPLVTDDNDIIQVAASYDIGLLPTDPGWIR